jgi:hypothetical protein
MVVVDRISDVRLLRRSRYFLRDSKLRGSLAIKSRIGDVSLYFSKLFVLGTSTREVLDRPDKA